LSPIFDRQRGGEPKASYQLSSIGLICAISPTRSVASLAQQEITSVIPSKANRKTPRHCDFALYCELISSSDSSTN
jgi:hypothetical protein